MKSLFGAFIKSGSFEIQSPQLISLLVSRDAPRTPEQAVPALTSADWVSQEPPRYLEEEEEAEEESFISEAMQQITDGAFCL